MDKKYVPKNLIDMIYNPRSNTSWFLKSMVAPPTPLRESQNFEPIEETVPWASNDIFEVTGESRTNQNIAAADGCVRKLIASWRDTKKAADKSPEGSLSYSDFLKTYSRWSDFVSGYIEWVSESMNTPTIHSCFTNRTKAVDIWFDRLRSEFDYADDNFRIISSDE
jgi:hypothetical protein